MATDDFDSTWPGFLDRLDSDRERAQVELYAFVKKLEACKPPPQYRWLLPADRPDAVHNLVYSLLKDDCRKLRQYRPMNRPFRYWLRVAWQRLLIDNPPPRLEPIPPVDPPEPPADPGVKEVLQIVLRVMRQLRSECQLLIKCALDGLDFKQMAVLIGLRPDQNRIAWARLDACRRRLAHSMFEAGVPLSSLPEKFRPGGDRGARP